MKNNLLKSVIILLAIAFVGLQGCEKKTLVEVASSDITQQEINVEKNLEIDNGLVYYLDNEVVDKKIIDTYLEKNIELFNITSAKKDKKDNIIDVKYYYTTEAGFIEYGNKHELKLKEGLEFTRHMREYAEKSGTIAEFEKTGIVPAAYSKYEAKYYKSIFGENQSKVYYKLADPRWSASPYLALPFFTTFPFLGSWNDRISSIHQVGVAGLVTIFERSWYRGEMGVIHFPPYTWTYRCYGDIDNNISSIISW